MFSHMGDPPMEQPQMTDGEIIERLTADLSHYKTALRQIIDQDDIGEARTIASCALLNVALKPRKEE